jgi:hypothetical protein
MGGKGPKVVKGPNVREIDGRITARLHRLAGADGSGLQRLEPAHALTFVVDPSLINTTSLRTGGQATDFQQVVWQPGAEDAEIIQFNGQHRIEALKLVFSSTLKEYKQVKNKPKRQARHDVLLETLNTKGNWLVAFYTSTSALCKEACEQHRS